MLKVGITGGIGSGKSTICRLFELLGVKVFYADTVAKAIMNTDEELISGLIKTFGSQTYVNGQLNRSYLGSIVFNDPEKLSALNALVHPAVFRAFDNWAAENADQPYVLKEAALLFESGSYKMCDRNILVTAPVDLKIKRIQKRDQLSPGEIQARMDKQFTDEEKLKFADIVLKNDEQELLIPQVLALHERFLKESTR